MPPNSRTDRPVWSVILTLTLVVVTLVVAARWVSQSLLEPITTPITAWALLKSFAFEVRGRSLEL